MKKYEKIFISKLFFRYEKMISFGTLIIITLSIPGFIFLYKSPDYYSYNDNQNFYLLRYKAAIWLKHNTDQKDIIGSWNAGQISFFSERKVINLDGLVNNNEYYERILSNNKKFNSSEFLEYLDEEDISYIVDYKFYGFQPGYANFTLIKEFTYDGLETPIQIWVKSH